MIIEIIRNFDFIIVGVTVVAMIIMGVMVLASNRHSVTNRTFFFLLLAIIFWSLLNYFSFKFKEYDIVLWILRFVMFFAVWFSFFIFQFLYVLPESKIFFSKKYKFILIPLVAVISILTLTPFVFRGIEEFSSQGEVSKVINGPAIFLFGITTISLNIAGLFYLIKKNIQSKIESEKHQYYLIFLGMLLTISLIVIFNFLFPAFLNESRYIALAALFTFPFIAFTSYAILKHGLFNVKVIATELLVFAIWIVVLIQFLMANTLNERLLGGGVFIFVVVSGILLIRSVKHEVRQREELQKLTHELQHANEELKQLDKAKSEFISIVSHQLRTPLSVTKGYVSMILEGIYGAVDEKIKETLSKVYVANEGLIALVNNLLDLSRMEAGTIKYEFTSESFEKMVDEIVMELELEAKHRDLWLRWHRPQEPLPFVKVDSIKFKQVIEILIENSLKYTPKGGVDVSLGKDGDALLFEVKDTGIGVDPKELGHLFNKFGRGAEGSKVNATGVGLGLYAAKQIVLAHGGQIWVESEGVGKGSTFCVKLPLAK